MRAHGGVSCGTFGKNDTELRLIAAAAATAAALVVTMVEVGQYARGYQRLYG